MRLFADHSIFAPGRVMWDHLDGLRPERPIGTQSSIFGCEDVLAVEYPNGVWLDVSYLGRSGDAHFVVAVMPPGETDEWPPRTSVICRTFDALKAAVLELTPVARDWKS